MCTLSNVTTAADGNIGMLLLDGDLESINILKQNQLCIMEPCISSKFLLIGLGFWPWFGIFCFCFCCCSGGGPDNNKTLEQPKHCKNKQTCPA
jgi:hypothetical protein